MTIPALSDVTQCITDPGLLKKVTNSLSHIPRFFSKRFDPKFLHNNETGKQNIRAQPAVITFNMQYSLI
jgi:hypothetical protein